jgi:hypothetical protein
MAIDLDGQDGLDGANVNANETPGNPYVFESAGSPSSIADGAINAKLNPANVRVQTGAGTGANGDIIFGGATAIVFDAGATSNNLSFAAHGSVFVNQATSCTNRSGHAPLLQR